MERNRISSLQSHEKALEKECCLPGVFCDSGDTPANLFIIVYYAEASQHTEKTENIDVKSTAKTHSWKRKAQARKRS